MSVAQGHRSFAARPRKASMRRKGRTRDVQETTGAMSWEPVQPPAAAPSGAAAFRPLSIGELFDRAFSIYFRHMLTFATVLFVATVPYALIVLLQLYVQRDILAADMSLLDGLIKHPSTPPDLSKLASAAAAQNPMSMVSSLMLSLLGYVVILVVLPLANAAVVSGVSRAYLGLPVRFRQCYEDAFKRWGWVLLLTGVWVGVLLPTSLFAFVIFFILVAVIAAFVGALGTAGAIIGSIIGIVSFFAFFVLTVMGYMAFASSFIACVLEKADPIRAFVLGITRIFGNGLFWRSLLVALSIACVYVGYVLVAAILAFLVLWLTKSFYLYFAIAQLMNLFYIAFAFVIVSIYYYDTRIRREGFDIQMLADQLAATKADKPTPPAATT
ncbi:MAG TPA: hypothetical protein VGX02_07795 [Candidatus Eremiobacteraceae bacterium]|nr:hypothetical protein [Candidatus Eremiobacteraceae bacterium]